jgi:hypothetical protein
MFHPTVVLPLRSLHSCPQVSQGMEGPRASAKRPAVTESETENPPKRKRVNVQHIHKFREHLASTKGKSLRKKKKTALRNKKRAIEDSPFNGTHTENTTNHFKGGMRSQDECTAVLKAVPEATSPNLFSIPAQELDSFRFTFGEHAGKTLFEVPYGYLLQLQESEEWKMHDGLEDAFHYWQDQARISRPRPPTRVSVRNWRIPDDAKVYAGWMFKHVPWTYRVYLSHQLARGRFLEGDWKLLREAFEYHHPDELPGCRVRASMQFKPLLQIQRNHMPSMSEPLRAQITVL